MPNPNLTDINFLLDNSGSMQSMGSEPIDGYNQFIKDQNDPTLGDAKVSLTLFGTHVTPVYAGVSINEVPPLDNTVYRANGMTCLRDAIGKSIIEIGARLAALPDQERPGNVLLIVLTDGEDTSSVEFSTDQIAAMIKEQTETYSWKIDFMGTTAASITSAKSYGIAAASTTMYANDKSGLSRGYADTSLRTKSLRTSTTA